MQYYMRELIRSVVFFVLLTLALYFWVEVSFPKAIIIALVTVIITTTFNLIKKTNDKSNR